MARGRCRDLRRGLRLGSHRRGRRRLTIVARRRCRGLRRGFGLARPCRGRGGVLAARVLHPGVQRRNRETCSRAGVKFGCLRSPAALEPSGCGSV